MPRGDQSGPDGMGPMTGRGAGYCNGYDRPGYANPVSRGYGRMGYGRGPGRGFGRGYRSGFQPVMPYGQPVYGGVRQTAPYYPAPVQFTPEQELDMRRKDLEMLEAELKAAKDSINKLEKEIG